MDFQYQLDRTPKKFLCPNCGKRRFVRYWDEVNKAYLNEKYGRCDREQNCAYHLNPYQDGLTDKNLSVDKNEKKTIPTPADTIPNILVEATFKNYEQNNFILFLKNTFGMVATNKVINQYLIGTSKHQFQKREFPMYKSPLGATIFWQIDIFKNVRTGKIMLYDASTGKRVKMPFSHNTWVHYELKRKKLVKQNFNLLQCLFGEHQLIKKSNQSKSIGIVESEKTAIILSILMPQNIWLATGGSGGISPEKLAFLQDKKVILYPDLGQYDNWKEKAKKIKNCKISVSKIIEEKATGNDKKQGYDLADYLLKKTPLSKSKLSKKIF